MRIQNKKLSDNEIHWLSTLLKVQFDQKEEIIKQINNAEINREYNKYFLSLKFGVDKKAKQINRSDRVPVEMRVYQNGTCPVQFLLHIVNGYVNELEVFCADSSEIDPNLEIDRAERIEVLVEK